MIVYFQDKIKPFRPEWLEDNVVNGKHKKNRNNILRDRTVGVYEDFTSGEIYLAISIRNPVDNPSRLYKKIIRNRIDSLRKSGEVSIRNALYFPDRKDVYTFLVREKEYPLLEVTEEARIIHGYLSEEDLNRTFDKIDNVLKKREQIKHQYEMQIH